jgi:hypothetical protein
MLGNPGRPTSVLTIRMGKSFYVSIIRARPGASCLDSYKLTLWMNQKRAARKPPAGDTRFVKYGGSIRGSICYEPKADDVDEWDLKSQAWHHKPVVSYLFFLATRSKGRR